MLRPPSRITTVEIDARLLVVVLIVGRGLERHDWGISGAGVGSSIGVVVVSSFVIEGSNQVNLR